MLEPSTQNLFVLKCCLTIKKRTLMFARCKGGDKSTIYTNVYVYILYDRGRRVPERENPEKTGLPALKLICSAFREKK